jgi:hypothetical protein
MTMLRSSYNLFRDTEFSAQEGYINVEMTSNFCSYESLPCCKKYYTQVPVA